MSAPELPPVDAATDPEALRRALADRDQFIRSLFEQSKIGLNLCRLDGLWLESNPAFLAIIGYTREEADGGLTYWQLTPRSYDEAEAKQLASLEATGQYGPYEKEFIRKDGTLVPVRLNGYIVERDGEKLIWSFIEDISAERALERQLDTERMKAIQASKLASLGEMAAAFAHEINNPLSIIVGYAYELDHAITSGDRAFIGEALSAIRDSAHRAARIVQGLKNLGRENAGAVVEDFPARDAIADALAMTEPRCRYEGVELARTIGTDTVVRGNALQLTQVLINLINNALDATRGRSPRHVGVTARDDDTGVIIAVSDNGPGIDPVHGPRIFDAFFTTKPKGEGTGLGLSISREIATSMKGTLTFERAEGRTCFEVRLPRVGAAP